MKRTMVILAMAVMVSGIASADTWYTMPGDSFSTTGGWNPWQGDTNFNVKLMTSKTAAAKYTNQTYPDYGLSYDNFEKYGEVVITGSFSASSLNLCTQSYVQVGLMTEAIIDNAENGYGSWLFNDSVMLSIGRNASNQYSINVSDYNLNGGRRSSSINFDHTKQLDYEMTLNFDTDVASLIINNNDGNGWSSPLSTQFGISDWGAVSNAGYGSFDLTQPEDYTSAALFANMYNESAGEGETGLTGTAAFGDISITPEPMTIGLLGLGGLVLARRRKA